MTRIGNQRAAFALAFPADHTTKVLLVAMPDSIHVARWLAANVDNNLDIMVFASSPMRRVHPSIRELLGRRHPKGDSTGLVLRIHKLSFLLAIPLWIADRRFFFGGRLRGLLIAAAIASFKPRIVHTMESQNGGYATYHGLRKSPSSSRPTTLLTLFGSDIYWFSRFEYHRKRLRELLSLTDFVQAECARDEALAKELAFGGIFLPLLPVSAGIPAAKLSALPSPEQISARKVIAVKGYAGKWGLAKSSIDALREITPALAGFTIELYSCDARVARYAAAAFRGTDVTVIAHPKFSMTHTDMLSLFSRSKLAIALSRSDGLPASMLEAMSQGAFPVQTGSACVEGWISDGVNGLVVNDLDENALAARLANLVQSNELLGIAAANNIAIISERYSDRSITNSASRIYELVLRNRNL